MCLPNAKRINISIMYGLKLSTPVDNVHNSVDNFAKNVDKPRHNRLFGCEYFINAMLILEFSKYFTNTAKFD